MPWRRTRDPYPIWVSEIMLQQTQVATALPYYERWMEAFPTVVDLAVSDEQRVLALWQGLGYYRRCKYLHKGAQWVVEHGMPTDYDLWLATPGVGPYTAAAICSICYNLSTAVVDGNVERVYSRVAADGASGAKLLKNAQRWADRQLYGPRAGDWNQAVMELGATICTPRSPKCEICPIRQDCVANQSFRVDEFPVKAPKPKTVHETRHVWIPFDGERFGIRAVEPGQWWDGMWEFPWTPNGEIGLWAEAIGALRHTVTRHRLTLEIWLVRDVTELPFAALRWLSVVELADVPMPAPQRKALGLAATALGLTKS